MQIILHQIVNCPFHGLIKEIYLQAKCLELMALKLEPDTAGERELMRSRPQFFCPSALRYFWWLTYPHTLRLRRTCTIDFVHYWLCDVEASL